MKLYGVWYFGVIVRGPFVKKNLAKQAIAQIKKSCSCAYDKLEIGEYDKAADRQMKGWTHPSVLALMKAVLLLLFSSLPLWGQSIILF